MDSGSERSVSPSKTSTKHSMLRGNSLGREETNRSEQEENIQQPQMPFPIAKNSEPSKSTEPSEAHPTQEISNRQDPAHQDEDDEDFDVWYQKVLEARPAERRMKQDAEEDLRRFTIKKYLSICEGFHDGMEAQIGKLHKVLDVDCTFDDEWKKERKSARDLMSNEERVRYLVQKYKAFHKEIFGRCLVECGELEQLAQSDFDEDMDIVVKLKGLRELGSALRRRLRSQCEYLEEQGILVL